MHVHQAYLEAAGLSPMDHRYRQLSTSYSRTPAAVHRPRRRNAKVFSRLIAFVKAYAERQLLARELYALNDHLLADIGITREDMRCSAHVRQSESAPIEYFAARQVSAYGAAKAAANDNEAQIAA